MLSGANYAYALVSVGFSDVVAGDFNGDSKTDLLLYRRSEEPAIWDQQWRHVCVYFGDDRGRYDFVLSGNFNLDSRADV